MFKEIKRVARGPVSSLSSPAPPAAAALAPSPCHQNTYEFVAIGDPHVHLANKVQVRCPFHRNGPMSSATAIPNGSRCGAGPPKE